MQIKQQALPQQMKKKIAPVYVLIGQDHYLLQDSLNTIKTNLNASHDCEEKIMSIQSTEDWNLLAEEANSYSLFSEAILINVIYEKKTIDAAGKKILTHYLNSVNSRCFIVIRAPNVPAKQIQWLTNLEQVVVVVAYPLNALAMKQWIGAQLKNHSMNFDLRIPELIHQYTQGNMLACSQVIEKIALANAPGSQINDKLALEHLSNQCDHNLYELVDACLLGQADKAIQIIRQAASNKTEPTLVLWMLTQEARILVQLSALIQQKTEPNAACSQLKIWPSRANLYQSRVKQLNPAIFQKLLRNAFLIDEQIKSNLNRHVWHSIEALCLSLCLGDICIA